MKLESQGLRPGISKTMSCRMIPWAVEVETHEPRCLPRPESLPLAQISALCSQEQTNKALSAEAWAISIFWSSSMPRQNHPNCGIVWVFTFIKLMPLTQSTTLHISSFEENIIRVHLRPIIILHLAFLDRPWTLPPLVAWLFEKIFLWELDNENPNWKRDIRTIAFAVKPQNWSNKMSLKWLISNLNKNNINIKKKIFPLTSCTLMSLSQNYSHARKWVFFSQNHKDCAWVARVYIRKINKILPFLQRKTLMKEKYSLFYPKFHKSWVTQKNQMNKNHF